MFVVILVVQAALIVYVQKPCWKLKGEVADFDYRYVDIIAEGISKADLSKSVGKEVETVPQIFIDEKPIGGCTDFEALMKEQFNVVA